MSHLKICEFLENFLRHNLIKIYTRTHQTAPIFFGELAYAPEPPSIYVQL